MRNLLKFVVLALIFALMIGAFECKNIKENNWVYSFGGRKVGAGCGSAGGHGGGGVGVYGGCFNQNVEGGSKRIKLSP